MATSSISAVRAYTTGSLEQKVQGLRELQANASAEALAEYNYRLDMSWIHHDSALEGVVYDPNELVAAIHEQVVSDSTLIPVYDEIRQYKAAVDLVRQLSSSKAEINLDTIKLIYTTLAPDESEGKGPPKYRKDMPLHRLYFHEIARPDKISYKMRQLFQWLATEEAKRTMHPTRIASRLHFMLLQIFPFPKQSGKVARLAMNLMLMREGYPPAVLHATDRQRYYEALKTSPDAVAALVNEALGNSVDSALRYFGRLNGVEEESA